MQTVPIQMPDGTTVPVRLVPAEGAHRHPVTPDAPRPVLVIVPGLGVPAGYYELFASTLAKRGFDVAIGEMRGNGDSRPKPSSSSTFGYHELVSVDFPAIFEVVREQFPDSTPYLLGHSMGGQLGVMYAARIRGRLGGLILIASGTPYYRGYRGLSSPGMLVGTAAMSLTANLAGFWPGDRVAMGFGRQSKVLISDWARLARTGRFVPVGADIDYEERIARLRLPVLSITMTGDDLTPPSSAEHLLEKLPNAEVTRWRQPEPLGHNGWIRQCGSTVDQIEKWLRDR
ncbi:MULTISPECIES: alpha/beta hydrolase family protein [Nocardia]|uniref:alpha/beta hydrolase family protein n=1 Tax=Nocardia TaxID=1817 RepID=UPI0015EF290A|nr:MULTISPECIES: alpha/beta fold hydrolase [Nocardia]MBF6218824.1 alpha/beta fold hydrolase [Nocardia abscessus]MBF6473054.1 alpha/beta fold hydrolase [Nocardia abscessus]MDE1668751.1 alpha/beta fold hydrolase [Nocardia gipuzkoensis]UGT70364.1 alpha/beta fold hydrolase [Nocardia gipuzkoensis]